MNLFSQNEAEQVKTAVPINGGHLKERNEDEDEQKRDANNPTSDGTDEILELMFDPVLNCYFDPTTNKYYELC